MCMLDTLLNAGDDAEGKVNGILGIYSPSCCLLLDRLGSAWVWTPGAVAHKTSRTWMVPSGFGSWVEFLSQYNNCTIILQLQKLVLQSFHYGNGDGGAESSWIKDRR